MWQAEGGAERKFMDVVEENIKLVGVKEEEDTEDIVRLGRMIGCARPYRKHSQEQIRS